MDALATSAADDPNISVDAPSLVEVQAAIAKLKNERASGADGITAECGGAEIFCGYLSPAAGQAIRISLEIWEGTSRVEGRYYRALYKGKGSRSECSSHRPITLLSVPGQVFAQVLLSRIEPLLVKPPTAAVGVYDGSFNSRRHSRSSLALRSASRV